MRSRHRLRPALRSPVLRSCGTRDQADDEAGSDEDDLREAAHSGGASVMRTESAGRRALREEGSRPVVTFGDGRHAGLSGIGGHPEFAVWNVVPVR